MKNPARKRVRLLEREERGLLGHGPSLLARNPGNRGWGGVSFPYSLMANSLLAQRKQVKGQRYVGSLATDG